MRLVRFLTTNLNEEKAANRNSVPPASEGRQHEGVEHRLSPHRLPSLARMGSWQHLQGGRWECFLQEGLSAGDGDRRAGYVAR